MKKNSLFSGVPYPLIFGHRGYSSIAPENTLSAFQKLLDHRIPGVELDIHLCSSGEIVVIHDATLQRVTGFEGIVEKTPWEEIRELDAGSWFGEEFRREKIPLLSDVFELLGDRVYYDIEIKHSLPTDNGVGEKLVHLVRHFGLSDKVLFSSFNPFALSPLKKLAPDIPTAVIYSQDEEVPRIFRRGQGRFLSSSRVLKPRYSDLTQLSMFLETKLFGYTVIPWTVNELAEGNRLLSMGVSGLISDDPGKLLPLLTLAKKT